MTTEQNVYSSDLKVKSRRINRFDLLLVFFVSLALWGLAQNSQQINILLAYFLLESANEAK